MRNRIVAMVLAAGALALVSTSAAQAAAQKSKKVPAACVVKTIGKLHIQFGYCP